jgi:hypothetical protein
VQLTGILTEGICSSNRVRSIYFGGIEYKGREKRKEAKNEKEEICAAVDRRQHCCSSLLGRSR